MTRWMPRVLDIAARIIGVASRAKPPTAVIDRSLRLTITERAMANADSDVVELLLSAPDGAVLPPWYPGAHLDVTLPSGRVRQFSLCGDHTDRQHYRIAVRRMADGEGGSREIHDTLQVGHELLVKGPRNAFPLAITGAGAARRGVRFIAGGIGITPILPMLRATHAAGVPWTLIYVGRSRESMPFLAELAAYGDRVTIRTDDEHGLPAAEDLLPEVYPGTAVYCCGPVPMMRMVQATLLDSEQVELHFERFSTPPIVDGVPFEVQLGSGGPVLRVPADRTALETIRDVRPDIAYSCRQGFCGTCQVKVLEGEPDHHTNSLTVGQQGPGDMLICISRAKGGRLVLDL